ncbi:DinB family protein [Bacteroides sp. UBA939]|uniref:DinB family protein n=1 Tax=Bacteroides sp. UBA939 TaxID=1946092 RepID=UPI0025BECAFA|nr:DinB family protein [Bacteroides sp. UBA939]
MDKREWSDKLKQLRSIIKKNECLEEAKELILDLHQMVYASEMSGINSTTFEDKLWNGINEETARKAVNKKGRTILYGIWHSTRIEDITMNLLVAGTEQIFEKDNWFSKINSPIRHTGNSLDANEILQMSLLVNIEELKAYRITVGRNTENIIRKLSKGEMKRKVCKEKLQRILDEKAVENVDSANWLIDFWGGKDVAGIILMPCLRHQLVHLNESMDVESCKSNIPVLI